MSPSKPSKPKPADQEKKVEGASNEAASAPITGELIAGSTPTGVTGDALQQDGTPRDDESGAAGLSGADAAMELQGGDLTPPPPVKPTIAGSAVPPEGLVPEPRDRALVHAAIAERLGVPAHHVIAVRLYPDRAVVVVHDDTRAYKVELQPDQDGGA